MNPRNEEATIRDKGILDVIWDSKKTPPLLAKNIRGAFLSKDSRLITMKQAIQTIMEAETDIVIKPSINSCCGRGVQILKKDVLSAKNLDTVLKGFNSDFVIQEKIQQSEETAKYNPTSLNTFRVTSLLINGEFSIPMINFKIGADGKEVDNIGGGNGGTMTGVDLRTGALSLGMNSNFEIIEERGGSKLNECCISALDKIKEFTKELHLRIPMMRFVGWDIALNKDNTPILIEANVNYPGIEFEQLLSGPCFGKRTQEVIEYIQERIKRRNE
ncbi:MAG: hypothetical protein LIP15_23545 [Clostridium sp.]|nr:hypothetical protein [Bacteroidales bacterium]MCC8087191.1 hypothetical protein [Clostridium sp.]